MGEAERENELAAWEARLGAFRPGASRLDRDQVMYLAGRAAALRDRPVAASRWGWPSAFAVMTTTATVLLVMLIVQPPKNGVLPSGSVVDLGQHPDSDQTADQVHGDSSPALEVPRRDLDALLAQLPAGRELSTRRPWEDVDSEWTETSAMQPSPANYFQRRETLLEELAPPNRGRHLRPQS